MSAPLILSTNAVDVNVRPATVDDVPLLRSFFAQMAAFEKLPFSATDDEIRAALFAGDPAARALLAFVDGRPAAYVVYYFTFSTMVGKRGLWLEDLFVAPEFRRRGIGEALMAHLADVAVRHRCGRFEWSVLDWNEGASRFYEALGARCLSDWRIFRVDGDALSVLAGRAGRST